MTTSLVFVLFVGLRGLIFNPFSLFFVFAPQAQFFFGAFWGAVCCLKSNPVNPVNPDSDHN
jgi:hypothetical protein